MEHSEGAKALYLRELRWIKTLDWPWCPGKDSNLHGLHRWYLKPVRLPIPPPGHGAFLRARAGACQRRVAALVPPHGNSAAVALNSLQSA